MAAWAIWCLADPKFTASQCFYIIFIKIFVIVPGQKQKVLLGL